MNDPQIPEVLIQTTEDLEKEKLQLEIAELSRAWWKKPAYIGAALPTILALMTIVYGFVTGYFQSEFRRLQNDKAVLEREKATLVQENARLKTEISAIRDEKAQVAVETDKAKARL